MDPTMTPELEGGLIATLRAVVTDLRVGANGRAIARCLDALSAVEAERDRQGCTGAQQRERREWRA